MDKVYRKSPLPDAVLYEHGSKIVASLEDDIEDFSAFDSTIDRKFINTLQGALDEVRNVKKDEVMIDEQNQLTEEVNRKMAACNKGYKTVAYFVRYTFDGDESIQNEFGLNDIKEARNNQAKLNKYLLPTPDSSTNSEDDLIIS